MSSTEESRVVERKVLDYLHRHRIAQGSRVLVALSGGPDSLCLLYVLDRLKAQYPLALHVAFYDHGIRSRREMNKDFEFIQQTCANLEVELSWDRLPQGELVQRARNTGRSLEEVARESRYNYLITAASGKQCEYIALGHTADDQVETLVMRFFQGVDLSGLPGIPEMRDCFIRPLYDCTRPQVIRYLSDSNLRYRKDATNRDRRYLRNAVRHNLLPAAERIFPGFRGSLLSLSKKLSRLRAYVDSESKRRLIWTPTRGGYRISGREFLAVPGVLRVFSITGLLNSLVVGRKRIPYRFLSRIEDDRFVRLRRIVLSGYGIRLYWRGEQLILAVDVVGHSEKGYFIVVKGENRIMVPEAGLIFESGSSSGGTIPVLFRSARSGDTIRVERGCKAVRKLFAEWRVAKPECWKIPILEDRRGIVAVFGGLFGYRDRCRAGVSSEQGKELTSMVHRYDVEVE
jgi:tRNA(Ile)-lysidine synthase